METVNHECYVSLEVAKLLKKAGFDMEGMSYYQNGIFYQYLIDKERIIIMNHNSAPNYMEQYSAPTLDVAQRWLREVKNVWIEVLLVNTTDPHYRVDLVNSSKYNNSYGIIHYADYKVYEVPEEAQEAGIKKALEMILKK